ncbi:SIR2 family protein [Pseudokineococcus sp. 1T1Z-3]|uniref:SIR2 family protein n=1 Tax=Pseudokineococcus sp. 1T1Z-3 TaxID=3132745 RepID=UPI0030AF1095
MSRAQGATDENGDVLALLGNGVSIAHNDTLAMHVLTRRLVERLNEAAGLGADSARALLNLVAANLGEEAAENSQDDFEALLGPFDHLAQTLTGLRDLSVYASDAEDTLTAIEKVSQFAARVRRLGVSHILEAIDCASRVPMLKPSPLDALLEALFRAGSHGLPGHLTIASLNYDSLVPSRITPPAADCTARGAFDLTGERSVSMAVRGRGADLHGRVLDIGRPTAGRHAAPTTLLQLHGSLSWLRSPDGTTARFEMKDLRGDQQMKSYWSAWRDGECDWTPAVILANQKYKSRLVEQHPFDIAYDQFTASLLHAERWLIAGYSFRDEIVNERLRTVFSLRGRRPQVLIVSKGADSPQSWVSETLNLREDDPATFQFVDGGLADLESTSAWRTWLDGVPGLY